MIRWDRDLAGGTTPPASTTAGETTMYTEKTIAKWDADGTLVILKQETQGLRPCFCWYAAGNIGWLSDMDAPNADAAIAYVETYVFPGANPLGLGDDLTDATTIKRALVSATAALGGQRGQEALTDLLADLMHWAESEDLDFEAALARGIVHYEAEKA